MRPFARSRTAKRTTRNRQIAFSLEALESRQLLTTVSGSITEPTIWSLDQSPYEVVGTVRVQAGAQLTIEPGVLVQFRNNTGLEVRGQLVAEGTPWQRIVFDRAAGASRWEGIDLTNTLADNRITFADMRYGDDQGEAINIDHSRLMLNHVTWSGTTGTILELEHPSLIVRNSQFPTSNGDEVIHGEHLSGDEYLVIDGNVFANSNNGGDVIDFLGADRPGPVLQVLNNLFQGGGDDGLDLDGTDAHIEGNVFMNFRKNTTRNTTANAIATGLPQDGGTNRTEITVVRNIFVNNDHALLLKEDAFARIEHNVIIDSRLAAIQFNEIGGTAVLGIGKGASLDGNILWNNRELFKNLTDRNGVKTELTVNRSLLPNDVVNFDGTPVMAHDLGADNLSGDPQFVAAAMGDFRLLPESPAIGAGLGGLDLGAMVPAGPILLGLTDELLPPGTATLQVAGPGITHYRYRIDGGLLSPLRSVDEPIDLQLDSGDHQLSVVAMNSAGEWFYDGPTTATQQQRSIQTIVPRRVRTGDPLPIVTFVTDALHKTDSAYSGQLDLANSIQLDATQLRIKKGMGTATPTVTATESFELSVPQPGGSPTTTPIELLDNNHPSQNYSGTLTGQTVWDSSVDRHIVDDLLIPVGSELIIEPGTRVLLGDKVNVRIEGAIRSHGTADDPIVFQSIDPSIPWGGIEVANAVGEISMTMFTNGGADPEKAFRHSNAQPVLHAVNSTLTCQSCFVINNVGKGFGSVNSRISIFDSVVAGNDTGGEAENSVVHFKGTWISGIPNDDRMFVDDDNDGFYFSGVHSSGEPSRFEDSFVIDTKDDGLDHNGASLIVNGAWIQGAMHEGIAGSNRNGVVVTDSVFVGNNQGIEAGYGAPEIEVRQSAVVGNLQVADPEAPITAGLRFGDGYDGRNGAYRGMITASELVLYENGDNVRNYDGSIPGPQPGKIVVTDSLTNDPDFDNQSNNQAGIPVFDAHYRLLRGSAGFTSGPEGMPVGRPVAELLGTLRVGIRGDFSGDGLVDEQDIDRFCVAFRSVDPPSEYDLNADGQVDSLDRDVLIRDILGTDYGDANLDGAFNSSDFVAVFLRGEYEDGVAGNSTWASGDWNCDGDFDSKDFIVAFLAGSYENAVRAVDQLDLAEIAAATLDSDEWLAFRLRRSH